MIKDNITKAAHTSFGIGVAALVAALLLAVLGACAPGGQRGVELHEAPKPRFAPITIPTRDTVPYPTLLGRYTPTGDDYVHPCAAEDEVVVIDGTCRHIDDL